MTASDQTGVAIALLAVGGSMFATCLPLIKRRVPMNRFYASVFAKRSSQMNVGSILTPTVADSLQCGLCRSLSPGSLA